MTYDYHGAWTYSVIGHNSPLYAQRSDQNKALSVVGSGTKFSILLFYV